MKFGKRLVRQAHSEWVVYYLNYKELKLQLQRSLSEGDLEGKAWNQFLKEELQRINKFFVDKESLLVRQYSLLEQQLEASTENISSLSNSFERYCRTLEIMRYYVVLNYMAIYKIIKKRNKTLKSCAPIDFTKILVDQPFYKSIKLARLTVKTELFALKIMPKEISVQNFTCPICLDVLCNPVVLSCTHRFCWSCLSTTSTTLQACPVCRKGQQLDPKNFTIDWILRDFLHSQFPNSQLKLQHSEAASGLIKQLEKRASSLDAILDNNQTAEQQPKLQPIVQKAFPDVPSTMSPAPVNKTNECKYAVTGKLGVGVFGEVFLATSKADPSSPPVALKKLVKNHPKFKLSSVHKEVNAGKLLSHESIIQYVEVFETISSIYMVLEYFEGKDLFAIMEGRLYKPLSESSAKNIFKQLISAVSYCHSVGVAHRDIKLENIMMNALEKIKLIDFGLCDFVTDSNNRKRFCQDSVGSPAYIAPEILIGKPYDGLAADIWSCGVVLFALLFGRFPYSPNQYKRLVVGEKVPFDFPECGPKAVLPLLQKMLSLDPKTRCTAQEIQHNEWLNSQPLVINVPQAVTVVSN